MRLDIAGRHAPSRTARSRCTESPRGGADASGPSPARTCPLRSRGTRTSTSPIADVRLRVVPDAREAGRREHLALRGDRHRLVRLQAARPLRARRRPSRTRPSRRRRRWPGRGRRSSPRARRAAAGPCAGRRRGRRACRRPTSRRRGRPLSTTAAMPSRMRGCWMPTRQRGFGPRAAAEPDVAARVHRVVARCPASSSSAAARSTDQPFTSPDGSIVPRRDGLGVEVAVGLLASARGSGRSPSARPRCTPAARARRGSGG